MNRIALLTLLSLSLAACQKKAATTDTMTTDTTTAAAPAASTPASTDTAAATAAATTDKAVSATTTAAANTQTSPAPIPSGYTLVSDLTSTPKRTFTKAPSYQLKDGQDYYAVIDTDKGQIVADLLEKQTPSTVNNFVFLARNHFYDGQRFHRVIDGFMAQTGDPKSVDASQKATWGTGGPGYQFPDEVRTALTFDAPGMLAMANSGPNTNGSQFFITFAPATFLNGGYSLFGKVISGQDILTRLTRTATSGQGGETPIAGAVPDKLLSVRIVTKP